MIITLAIIGALFIGINALLGLVLWTIASIKEYRNDRSVKSTRKN